MDSDSDDEILGVTAADISRQVDMSGDVSEGSSVSSVSDFSDEEDEVVSGRAPSGYNHSWLRDFSEVVGLIGLPDNISEVDMFRLFITDDILKMLVTETNHASLSHSFKKWKEVTADDMRSFIAVTLVMGLAPRSSYDLYWTTESLLEMPGFRKIISRNRFQAILSFLHLVDNTTAVPRGNPGYSKAFKIRPFVDALLPLFQRHFTPSKELSVDESMIAFKGRTNLMQYMPLKPSKWGMKAWALADSKTGYLWNWQLYLGKEDTHDPTQGLAHRVVTSLVAPLYGKGHVVNIDNFFSSPVLFKELAVNQTGACGTLRSNRRGVPAAVKAAKPKAGEHPITARDDNLLYISWCDKRPLNLITTAHDDNTFENHVRSKHHAANVRVVTKPCAVESYTRHMGGVDRLDKQLTCYLLAHRTCKWWKKACFVNSLVLWRAKYPGRVKAEKFRVQIARGLLALNQPRASSSFHDRRASDPPARISASHYPALNPKRLKTGKHALGDCAVCSDRHKKRHQTTYVCATCHVSLCPHPCFGRYHSLVNYKIDCCEELHD
ncbi:unnamed protein product [Candidula unifasciata]|uniref:PiggyBac transposable element-derived protein domain-containing protein n=1 Tax=Candidula unifasciata TaxID=100452 RepID=A0A8S3Z2H9_9EUPU|nr:unnamed protein product [Candidula unifasciata]